jgi:hypothetical protein
MSDGILSTENGTAQEGEAADKWNGASGALSDAIVARSAESTGGDVPPFRQFKSDLAIGVPVCGFTGINGAGKTLLAVQSAIADMARGRVVYSTVPISSPWGDSLPIVSLGHLLTLRDVTILLDDISVIFSSRTTQSLPGEIVTLLQTLRHHDLKVLWTAPQWMRADTMIRGVTQGLVNVVPWFRVRDPETPWPRPRIVGAGLLDTSTGKQDATPDKVLRRRFVIPSRLAAWGAYDTRADTPVLGHRNVGGVCVDCYGSRERPKHNRERHELLGIPFFEDDGGPGGGDSAAQKVATVETPRFEVVAGRSREPIVSGRTRGRHS